MKASKQKKKATRRGNESSAPVAISKLIRSYEPRITSSGGNIRIQHREFIGDVSSIAGGEIHSTYFEANPGLYSTFPWLSAIAQRFESYTFNKLGIEYVPMCGTSTTGAVLIAPDFDVSDWIPEDIISISSYPGCVRSSLWQPCRMECDPRNLQKMVKERYVRSDDVENVDLKLYDTACLYVFTYGASALATVGSIWVDYDVTLRTPSMDSSIADEDSGKILGGGGVTKADLFGPTPSIYNGSAYEPVVDVMTVNTMRFKRAGKYLLNAVFTGTGLNTTGPDFAFPSASDGNYTKIGGIVDAAATSGWYDQIIEVLRPCTVALASTAAWTTVTAMNLRFAPYKLT